MLLAIDIGNTNISWGIFSSNKIIKRFNIATKDYKLQKIKSRLGNVEIDDSIICSVVPAATCVLEKDIRRLFHHRPYILGKNIQVPIKNLYYKPKQVGQDRLVNAYAGIVFFGTPLIVIDFGTAVTFDIVSKNKAYLGGIILPGLEISLTTLAEKTALLPKIKLERPRELIGRDTKTSMLSGIVYGLASAVEGLIQRVRQEIGNKAPVVATGGNIHLIRRYYRGINKIDTDLTLKGLNLIYCNFLKKFL